MSASGQSWSSVLQSIISNVQEIVRSEVRLAKTEIKDETQAAAKAGITLGVGAVLATFAFGFLLLCVMYALTLVVAGWLAALLVGIAVATVSLILISAGAKKLKRVRGPVGTIESVKETVQWAKNQGS